MNYKGIIFDLDGTIIQTTDVWTQATKDLLKKRGIVLTKQEETKLLAQVHGLATHASCTLLKKTFALTDQVSDLAQELYDASHSKLKKEIQFVEGFAQFHAQITAKNIPSGVATNAGEETVRITNAKLNLERFFGKHLYGIWHVNYVHKPNPDIYLHTAKQLQLHPHDCIAIEDSAHGIHAAQRAGMFCVGINTAQDIDQIKHADLIIQGYHELDLETLVKKKKI